MTALIGTALFSGQLTQRGELRLLTPEDLEQMTYRRIDSGPAAWSSRAVGQSAAFLTFLTFLTFATKPAHYSMVTPATCTSRAHLAISLRR